eukprot:TRINITY_DN69463_c0_g1_i1.p1 TRINITY_DN69463_c0_g1~~TRINITY_DN69463_c0_g1_i1.p1  ORF type:complete len:522 (+),score=101.01 TRINITY_DN69463_c0_g1_i1:93-1658(+)
MAIARGVPAMAAATGSAVASARSKAAMADLALLVGRSRGGPGGNEAGAPKAEVAKVSAALAQQLRQEWSSFGAHDVVRIVGVFARLVHRHPPLMEAAAAHTLRGLVVYPLFALCNIANGFARLDYKHQPLLQGLARHLSEPSRTDQLSPIDVASVVYAYAQLAHRAGDLMDACARRLKVIHREVDGPNCATILNSYARLSECDPELFNALARSVIQTNPRSFAVHHISIIMNAFAKCQIRKPGLLHLLAGFIDGRLHEMSPQNVANVANAFARLEVYEQTLFWEMQKRIVSEDLSAYKSFELANLTHSLAKLNCGSRRLFGALFSECISRSVWEPRSVAQLLDAMRRQRRFHPEELLIQLMGLLVRDLRDYEVQQLTQAAWCIVDLDALELAARLPPAVLEAAAASSVPRRPSPPTPPRAEGDGGTDELVATVGGADVEPPSRLLIRIVFERMEELAKPSQGGLTPTQLCYVQQLARDYRYKYELEFGLLPQHVKAYCRSLFEVSTTVTSSMARPPQRRQL